MLALTVLAAAGIATPRSMEAELAAARAQLPAAIAGWEPGLERSEEDLARWKDRAEAQLDLWTAFRDARCDARLLAYEGAGETAPECRDRITRVILGDLRFRFDLAPGGRGRASIEATATGAGSRENAEEEGPCAHAPPAECDYCGMNKCWERRLKADDAALNAAWRAVLARIAAAPGKPEAVRTDWAVRLRKTQRLWLRWRDETCALDAWETPNPYAHSVYALVTGPCLDTETRARTDLLRRTYRLR